MPPTPPCDESTAVSSASSLVRDGRLRRGLSLLRAARERCPTGASLDVLRGTQTLLAANRSTAELVAFARARPPETADARRAWDRARQAYESESGCDGNLVLRRVGVAQHENRTARRSPDGTLRVLPYLVLPLEEQRWWVFREGDGVRPNPHPRSGVERSPNEYELSRTEAADALRILDAHGYAAIRTNSELVVVRMANAEAAEASLVRPPSSFFLDQRVQLNEAGTALFILSDRRLEVFDWPALATRFQSELPAAVQDVRWVGQDRILVSIGSESSSLLDASDGGQVLDLPGSVVTPLPEAGWLTRAVVSSRPSNDWFVRLHDLSNGEILREFYVPNAMQSLPQFAAVSSEELVAVAGNGEIARIHVPSGRIQWFGRAEEPSSEVYRVGATEDGFLCEFRAVFRYSSCQPEVTADLRGHGRWPPRHGRQLLCLWRGDTPRVVNLPRTAGGGVTGPGRALMPNAHAGPVGVCAIDASPDGSLIVALEIQADESSSDTYDEAQLLVISAQTGEVRHRLVLPDTTRIYASIDLTFSPDGQRVSLVYDRHVYVLDVASGAWVIEAEPFPELNVYWTDDSTMLYGFEIDPIPVRRDALTSLLPDSRIPPREFLSATGVLSWAKGGDAWDLRTGQPVPPPIGAPSPVSVLPGFEATSHGYAVVSESRRRTELIPVSPHGAVAFYPGGYAELLGDATLDAAQVFCDFCGSEAPAEVCTEQQLVAGHYAAALRGESPIWP